MARAGMALALFAAAGPAICADAGGEQAGYSAFLDGLRAKAAARGISQPTIDAVFADLPLNQRVIALDRAQPGGTPNAPIPDFEPYRRRHVDAARIARGRAVYQAQRARLATIERETGVPEAIMVAIWGNETDYGAVKGSFDLPGALATLAYDGRRGALFEDEFLATLAIIDRGVPRDQLKGSWAGATGNPQFLPSVYLRLARDGDGDGRADIWTNDADTLASIANYFANAGWRRGEPWGLAVSVPARLDRTAIAPRSHSPRCARVFERQSAWRSIAEWRALGITTEGAWPDDTVQAALIEPDGAGKTAYLVTGNYRVILDYNCSNFYALSVGLLADAVAR